MIYWAIILPLLALQIGINLVDNSRIVNAVTSLAPIAIAFSPMIVAHFITLDAKASSRTERRMVVASPVSRTWRLSLLLEATRPASPSTMTNRSIFRDDGRHRGV